MGTYFIIKFVYPAFDYYVRKSVPLCKTDRFLLSGLKRDLTRYHEIFRHAFENAFRKKSCKKSVTSETKGIRVVKFNRQICTWKKFLEMRKVVIFCKIFVGRQNSLYNKCWNLTSKHKSNFTVPILKIHIYNSKLEFPILEIQFSNSNIGNPIFQFQFWKSNLTITSTQKNGSFFLFWKLPLGKSNFIKTN